MPQIKPLTEELQKISIEELGEVPSRIPADLQALKTWIVQEPHLKARTDDQFLIQFLRGCKYSREKAKEKLDLFFSLKSKYPAMFNPTRFRELQNLGCYTLFPKPLNETGPRIVAVQFNYSPQNNSAEDTNYSTSALFELSLLNDPYAGIQGLVYIFDFAKVSANHVLQLTPNFCKKIITFLEKSLPVRNKAGYFINIPSAAQAFLRLLFSLSTENVRKRLHILGHDLNELRQYIPLKYPPLDYGGENGLCSQLTREYSRTFESYRNYFKENGQFGTDESLRPGNPLDFDGLFGLGGSFRQLAVD